MLFWSVLGALWVVALVLVFLVVVIFRQFGLMYIGSRALVEGRGLSRGSSAPNPLDLEIDGVESQIAWSTIANDRCWVVVLSEQGCPIMNELMLGLDTVAEAWADEADIIVIDRVPGPNDNVPDKLRELRDVPSPRLWSYARSHGESVHDDFDYAASPTVYLIAADGRVLARELVGGIRQISAMLAYMFDDRLDSRLRVS